MLPMEVKNTIICPYCGTENEGRLCKECAAVLRTREEQAKVDAAIAAGVHACPSSPTTAKQTASNTERQMPEPEPALAGVSAKVPGTGSASMAPVVPGASMGAAPAKPAGREVPRSSAPVGKKEPGAKEKRPNHLLYAVVTIIEILIILVLLGLIVYLLRDVPVFREVYSFFTGIFTKLVSFFSGQ